MEQEKTLHTFLESEKKEVFYEIYDNDVDNEYRYKWESWINAHDQRLIEKIREIIKNEREDGVEIKYSNNEIPPVDVLMEAHQYAETHKEIWNETIDHLLSLLTNTKV